MLKACWDCVAGSEALRNGGDNEPYYGTQLNGDSQRVPLRPTQELAENMFLIPRRLKVGDTINITANLDSPQRFVLNLLTGDRGPDYQNIACQFEANFPVGSSSADSVTLRIIQNNSIEIVEGDYRNSNATSLISGPSVNFVITSSENRQTGLHDLEIFIDDSFLHQFSLKHDIGTVTFVEMQGDVHVKTLGFEFV